MNFWCYDSPNCQCRINKGAVFFSFLFYSILNFPQGSPKILQWTSRGSPKVLQRSFLCRCAVCMLSSTARHPSSLPLPAPPSPTSSPLCNSCLTVHQQVPPTAPSKPVKHFTGGRSRHWDSCRNISSGPAGGAVVPPLPLLCRQPPSEWNKHTCRAWRCSASSGFCRSLWRNVCFIASLKAFLITQPKIHWDFCLFFFFKIARTATFL